jgi:GTPase SAR1 family protein
VLEILDTAGTEQFSKADPFFSPSLTRRSTLVQWTPQLTQSSSHEVISTSALTPSLPLTRPSYRELYMKTGQGFLLVFSITSLSSLNELSEIRDQIIRIKDDPSVPIVLVGNKCDLEEDRAVSRGRAFAVSQSWGNAPYYETSARRRANVDECFRDLCRQIIRRDQEAARAQGQRVNEDARHGGRAKDSKSRRKRRSKRDGPCTIL